MSFDATEASSLGGTGIDAKWCRLAVSSPTPSVVKAVHHLGVASCSIMASWLRSIMKVDCGTLTESWLAMRVKMRSVRPMVASAAGTKEPTCHAAKALLWKREGAHAAPNAKRAMRRREAIMRDLDITHTLFDVQYIVLCEKWASIVVLSGSQGKGNEAVHLSSYSHSSVEMRFNQPSGVEAGLGAKADENLTCEQLIAGASQHSLNDAWPLPRAGSIAGVSRCWNATLLPMGSARTEKPLCMEHEQVSNAVLYQAEVFDVKRALSGL
ncbi:MAG: hypothetical protein FRX49_01967 [Trebouxia sp. A1-2]|nr:MAG: hypothetical protein FRX49_01967 [Trebouxia sp. A1-2]